jgi:hypothetical protein
MYAITSLSVIAPVADPAAAIRTPSAPATAVGSASSWLVALSTTPRALRVSRLPNRSFWPVTTVTVSRIASASTAAAPVM